MRRPRAPLYVYSLRSHCLGAQPRCGRLPCHHLLFRGTTYSLSREAAASSDWEGKPELYEEKRVLSRPEKFGGEQRPDERRIFLAALTLKVIFVTDDEGYVCNEQPVRSRGRFQCGIEHPTKRGHQCTQSHESRSICQDWRFKAT